MAGKKKGKKSTAPVKSRAEIEAEAKAAAKKAKAAKKKAKEEAALIAAKNAKFEEKAKQAAVLRAQQAEKEAKRLEELAEKLAPAALRLKTLREAMFQWRERDMMAALMVWQGGWLVDALRAPLPEEVARTGRTAWHWRAQQGQLEVGIRLWRCR